MQTNQTNLNESVFDVVMGYAVREIEEQKDYICTYCQQPYATPQTRANHWSKSEKCSLFLIIQRVEDLLLNLECLGCFKTFPQTFNCNRHMKKFSLVDKSLIKNKQRLYDEKEIDRWNYGKMRSLKQIQDPKQSELRVPEFIYEVKGGYICQAWINYFKQQFKLGLPIKLQSDVRNDYLWENLIAAMLKVVGALFKIVVQDNPWKGQKALPYEYLSNKSQINSTKLNSRRRYHILLDAFQYLEGRIQNFIRIRI
ncbi:hypothetical protein OXYTRIMIC_004 [Oxytricha trifallax]|uniref:Uncharacterized protein n=1 Tax=Oxytricha trifallax TaxID=1172189 RepID=A0A073HZA5_9SPIT|nr:hypothetical protein OXYTRIMIC_004 [Oxytricha trifallax]